MASGFEDDSKALSYSSLHPIISQMLLTGFNIEDCIFLQINQSLSLQLSFKETRH